MNFREQGGVEAQMEPSDRDLIQYVLNSLDAIRMRSSVVECRECGVRFLVNNQDFHQVVACPVHR